MKNDYKKYILEQIPKDWKILPNATTAPKGYAWYYNGKNILTGEFKCGLIKTEV